MITATKLVTAEKIFRTIYNQAIQTMTTENALAALLGLATIIDSVNAEEDYRWLGALPVFTEWLGDVTKSELLEYSYTLRNKHFAASVPIDRDEIDDDRFGVIMPRIQGLAMRSQIHKARLIHQLLVNGTSNQAYDGVAFFAAAGGARPNNNLLTGSISASAPTSAQVERDITTARIAMLGFVDDKGEIIGLTPDTFVVPPNLEALFRQLRYSSADPANSNANTFNPYSGWIKDIIVDPALTDSNDFYALCTTYPVKPFVYQDRQSPDLNLDSSQVLVNRALNFVCDYRGNAGYTLPVLAAKVVSAIA